jgi:hypothetical protein
MLVGEAGRRLKDGIRSLVVFVLALNAWVCESAVFVTEHRTSIGCKTRAQTYGNLAAMALSTGPELPGGSCILSLFPGQRTASPPPADLFGVILWVPENNF